MPVLLSWIILSKRILVECSQVVEEEKTDMIFGEKTEEQKRVAELVREVKELRKELLASKLDKKQVEVQMKELKDALELGGNLRQGYVDSQEHMAVARRGLINMMEDMNEIPIEDVKRDLDRLNGHLDQIYHECSIREDDPDFKSSRRTQKYGGKYGQDQSDHAAERVGKSAGIAGGYIGMAVAKFFCTRILSTA